MKQVAGALAVALLGALLCLCACAEEAAPLAKQGSVGQNAAEQLNAMQPGASQDVATGENASATQQPAAPSDPALGWCFATGALGIACVALVIALTLCLRRGRRTASEQAKATKPEPPASVLRISQVGNVHHPGKRPSQQDAFGVSPLGELDVSPQADVLAVVADGMGGLEGGDQISKLVVQAMLQGFANRRESGGNDALLQLVAEAQRQAIARFGTGEASGSTLVAALVQNGWLYFASIGDSRIALVRGGALISLNREHTYGMELDELVARGEGDAATAQADAQRAALTSYVGMRSLRHVDWSQRPVRLCPGDQLVLMTDGVYRTLTDAQIVGALSGGAALGAERLEALVLAQARPQQDNFTAILLQWED